MKTNDVIEGLQILAKYRNEPGYDLGAEHDCIYAYATDKPVERPDLERLVELGWFQEDAEHDDEFTADNYAPDESWTAYV